MRIIKEAFEFDWDEGNMGKNTRHKVSDKEAEEVFFDKRKVVYKDVFHSQDEERFIVLGKTKEGRLLYVVYTERSKRIRIISARDINKKEVPIYEKTAKNSKV